MEVEVTKHASDPPVRYDGGVMFWMTDGKVFVTVRVSDEALSDADGSAKPNASTLTIFQRRRYAVESVARRKIANARREKDGSIMVRTIDLNG